MHTLLEKMTPWLIYPCVMMASVAAYFSLLNINTPLLAAIYVPVVGSALLITFFEWRTPHRRAWHPRAAEIKTDARYLLVVQVALPYLVSMAFMLWLVQPLRALHLPLATLWPQHWSVAAQTLLMILCADFLRYWLHRAAHANRTLWSLHAVHHAPTRLYWLNVGRFHPLEKPLQMLLDGLPFLLLGVSEAVIALYFVLYAVNGFFQHCNIRLNYGLLNYVVGSAATHRWHHARAPQRSCNFGNTVIVWDLLFGTWYLPKHCNADDVGVRNKNYPQSFAAQLRAPFTPQLAEQPVPLLSWREIALRSLLWAVMRWRRVRDYLPLWYAAQHPARAQQRVLQRILTTNKHTRFGNEHGFENIRDYTRFQQQVPVQTYESVRPYVDQQAYARTPALTAQTPMLYARTSGTTAKPKLIPVVPAALDQYRTQQRLLCCMQYARCPQAFTGKALGLVSPMMEGVLAGGAPFGSISGYLYRAMPRGMRKHYLVPYDVFEIEDHELKYLVVLRLALQEPNLTYLAAANPSSFLRLLELVNTRREALFESVASGAFPDIDHLPEPARTVIRRRLHADPERADALRALPEKRDLSYADLWPTLQMVTTWSGGSCGIALNTLKAKLPQHTVVYDLGYIASELRATLSLDGGAAGLPMLRQHFFEFAERAAWEQGHAKFETLEQLHDGGQYYVFVTTASGLYRYAMDDVVEVSGFFQRTPLLIFLQKGAGATNLIGEKLYESHIIAAVRRTEIRFGIRSVYCAAVADETNPSYTFYLESDGSLPCASHALATYLDAQLCELNLEYRSKRTSGRLRPLAVYALRAGTAERYKQQRLRSTRREAQYKPVILHYRRTLEFPFQDHCITTTSLESHHG